MADPEPGQTPGRVRILSAAGLFTPEEAPGPACVVVEGTRIGHIWPATTATEARERLAVERPDVSAEIVDLGALRLAPGFIDLHIHGYHGYDVNAGSSSGLREMARLLPRGGTTAFYPTIATTSRQHTAACVRSVVAAVRGQGDQPMAEIVGLRLEGPFINPARKGAQFAADIRTPDAEELQWLVEMGEGLVRFLDFAPEEDKAGEVLRAAVRLGVVPCIGHSDASYDQAMQAIAGGVRHSAHLFNAMSPLQHHAPGIPGALLTDDRATVEIIADGVHIASPLLRLVVRARQPRDVALVTDAMSAAGLPDGEYEFLHRQVYVRGRAARLADGALAGSTLTLDTAVRNIVAYTSVNWATAIEMATATPARIGGIASRKGRLAPGYDADIIALDAEGRVARAWTRGTLAS